MDFCVLVPITENLSHHAVKYHACEYTCRSISFSTFQGQNSVILDLNSTQVTLTFMDTETMLCHNRTIVNDMVRSPPTVVGK